MSEDELSVIIENTSHSVIKEKLIETFCNHIDQAKLTINTDVDNLDKSNVEIAIRLGQIPKLRSDELNIVSAGFNKETKMVDLRPLWLTSYGFEILASIDIGTKCSVEEFTKIQTIFQKIGYRPEYSEGDGIYYNQVSDELRDYILLVVERINLEMQD